MFKKISKDDLDPEKVKKGIQKKVAELKHQLAAPLPESSKKQLRKEVKRLLSQTR